MAERNIAGTAWSIINPINTFQFQYLTPLGLITTGVPSLMAGKISFQPLPILGPMIAKQFPSIGNSVVGNFLLRGVLPFEALSGNFGLRGSMLNQSWATAYRKAVRNVALDSSLYKGGFFKSLSTALKPGELFSKEESKVILGTVYDSLQKQGLTNKSMKLLLTKGFGKKFHNILNISSRIMYFGRAANILSWSLMAKDIGQFIGSTASNLAFGAIETASSLRQRMANVEFGGTLSGGFTSSASATERQRGIQLLQQTSLRGNMAFGNEAAGYHG